MDFWTDEDIQILIDNVEDMTTRQLKEKFFPNRSTKAINRKIEKLRDKGLLGKRSRDAFRRSKYGG